MPARTFDGRHSLAQLIGEAEARDGSAGSAVLAHLLADLGEHGLLCGVEGSPASAPGRGLRRLLTPRVYCRRSCASTFERLDRKGGYLLFSHHGLAALSAIAVAGLIAFGQVIAGRDVTRSSSRAVSSSALWPSSPAACSSWRCTSWRMG